MKNYILPENGNFYKANLHSHSTVSDGTLTPEEMKELYKSRGYSILCCTDHEIMVPHHELTDEDFLMLTGFELGFDEEKEDFLEARVCDLCVIALDKSNITQPFFHRTKYHNPERNNEIVFDENEPDHEREYSSDCINRAIKICREKGFFVTYNHPSWSLEHYEDYIKYSGMNAMEICNFSSLIDGYDEYNSKAYDDFLRKGERIFCIAADDNHNRRDPQCRMWDSFGAFTVIKADSLTYEAVAHALKKGHFYSSQGPYIHGMWLEEDKLHIECSPADKVVCTVNKRRCMSRYNEETGEITHAVFELKPSDGYFRVTVIDKNGLKADTNAYFTDSLNIPSEK